MISRRFDLWRRRGSSCGQRELADTVRALLFRADEHVFDRLDYEDDSQFLHPTQFAYLTDGSAPVELDQMLYGLVAPSRRPPRIRLRTGHDGRAFLGPLGIVETDHPDYDLDFGRDADQRYVCYRNASPVAFRFCAPVLVPGTSIQIATDVDPVLRRFFETDDGTPIDTDSIGAPRERISDALIALALLREHCAAMWAEIASAVRLIVLFRGAAPNSFAALSAHGAIFCNLQRGESEIALVEDIAHQGAHVIFNAFAHDPSKLLKIPGETTIREFAGVGGDARSLHVVLHALFTYTLILPSLIAVRESGCVSDVCSHELLGRIGFTLQKFAHDLSLLRPLKAYTPAGRRCYDAFSSMCSDIEARYAAEVAPLDYSGQPYVFDYACFRQRNDGPWPALSEAA
jgi:HEXXH motif-containing protein